ncbi:inhibitor i9 domain-containing protein [Parachaetomium inaequale]|uniref:Inhibitor i9 domain-containing protein n=1 Tax=Parachaetomium inaequale TaxID=2588326 RepID=A0AAN6PI45_9PEZI|nr:inhibitor i9 domain-containing protein [Parachaetomium inaequale]
MPSYIVICKSTATPPKVEAAKQYAREKGATVGADYAVLNGFQVSFDDDVDALDTMRRLDSVDSVEIDQEIEIQS